MNNLRYELVQCEGSVNVWRVEAIDEENEGVIYMALFSGPDARAKAQEYAAWKSARKGNRPVLAFSRD